MSKSKKKSAANGRNRQEKRAATHNPHPKKSQKPIWLRIVIIATLLVMLLGFIVFPLLR